MHPIPIKLFITTKGWSSIPPTNLFSEYYFAMDISIGIKLANDGLISYWENVIRLEMFRLLS